MILLSAVQNHPGKPWLPITWVGIIGSLEVVIVLSGVRRLSQKRCFWILPTDVRGNVSRNSTASGTL